jgi:hypothetical protein
MVPGVTYIKAMSPSLLSRPCTYKELISPEFSRWTNEIKESTSDIRRKIWEFDFILDTLWQAGMMNEGRNGLGFAVGHEPLPAVFAKYGCNILATDLDIDEAQKEGWVDSNQHAGCLRILNENNICDQDLFHKNCRFKNVDMNHLPDDLGKFDFIWSSCALEHLGSIKKGKEFIYNSLKLVKPGGIAVHTTEYNITSNYVTIGILPKKYKDCLFRKRDFEDIAKKVTSQGHEIHLSFELGNTPADTFVDIPPYKMNPHLKLMIRSRFNSFVCTSYGIVIKVC